MSQADPGATPRDPSESATYDVGDLAAMLKLSERTVWRLTDDGLIPGKLRIGRSVRWSRRVIDQWIRRGCPRPEGPSAAQ